jgi:hypothetical protein
MRYRSTCILQYRSNDIWSTLIVIVSVGPEEMTRAQRNSLAKERSEIGAQVWGHLPLESFDGATVRLKHLAQKNRNFEHPDTDQHSHEAGVFIKMETGKSVLYGEKCHFVIASETHCKCTKCHLLIFASSLEDLAQHAAWCKRNANTHCDIYERPYTVMDSTDVGLFHVIPIIMIYYKVWKRSNTFLIKSYFTQQPHQKICKSYPFLFT